MANPISGLHADIRILMLNNRIALFDPFAKCVPGALGAAQAQKLWMNLQATYDFDQGTKRRKTARREVGGCVITRPDPTSVTTQVFRLKTEGYHSFYPKCWMMTHDRPLKAFSLQSIHLSSYMNYIIIPIRDRRFGLFARTRISTIYRNLLARQKESQPGLP